MLSTQLALRQLRRAGVGSRERGEHRLGYLPFCQGEGTTCPFCVLVVHGVSGLGLGCSHFLVISHFSHPRSCAFVCVPWLHEPLESEHRHLTVLAFAFPFKF